MPCPAERPPGPCNIISISAASGNVCPVDDAAGPLVIGVLLRQMMYRRIMLACPTRCPAARRAPAACPRHHRSHAPAGVRSPAQSRRSAPAARAPGQPGPVGRDVSARCPPSPNDRRDLRLVGPRAVRPEPRAPIRHSRRPATPAQGGLPLPIETPEILEQPPVPSGERRFPADHRPHVPTRGHRRGPPLRRERQKAGNVVITVRTD